MTRFHFKGNPYPDHEEQKRAIQAWNEKLGPFREEFDEKNGIVTFDYSFPETDQRRISFVLGEGYELSDFIARFNIYIREAYGNTD